MHSNAFAANWCRLQNENPRRSSCKISGAALKQRKFFCSCSFLEYSLAKHILMTYKSLRIFSFFFFVSVAVKQFTRSDGINLSCSSKCEILLVCVCILALVTLHVNRSFSAPHYIIVCGLSGSAIFFHIFS